ncbi:MAG: carbon monoxide dehydrogenase subunit G [Acidobacteriota bacterium]
MKIEGTQEVRAQCERVYEVLLDPEVLQRCIPGCEKLEQTDENAYAATLRTGIGAIKGVFTGKVRIEDMQPPTHYRMVIEGKGQPGFIKGTGNLDLEERGETTLVKYEGDAQVGGTLASVGQRMIQGAARMMAAQFFAAIEVEAQRESHQEPPKHGIIRNAFRATKRALQKTSDENETAEPKPEESTN